MLIVALLLGLAVAGFVWFFASHYLALFVLSAEEQKASRKSANPGMNIELFLCLTLFAISIGLAILITAVFIG